MAGRPEGPSSPELEQGWQGWRGGTIQGSQPRCPPPTDSATARCPPFAQLLLGVPPTASAWCVLQAPDPAAYPCTRTPVHTCALTPTPDTPVPLALLLSIPCLSPGPAPPSLFLPTLSASQVPSGPQEPCNVLCFSILGVSGRQRRKHVRELDVPWMFNQERRDC